MESVPPACLIALVQLSEEMAAEVPSPLGEFPANFVATYSIDQLIESLVFTANQGPLPIALELAVIGYSATEQGVHFTSLLPNSLVNSVWVPLETLLHLDPAPRAEGPRRWVLAPECSGEAAPGAALGYVHRLLVRWLGTRYYARPPVVVHYCDATGWTERTLAVAHSLSAFTTASGPARIFHASFIAGETGILPSNTPLEELPALWAALRTECLQGGVSINDDPLHAMWNLIFDDTECNSANFDESTSPLSTTNCFWTQKLGNEPNHWEDAFVVGECGTRWAVADGAGEGIFSKQLAMLLAEGFVNEKPDLTHGPSVAAWGSDLRRVFNEKIDYANLRWSQQKKVDDVGAAATLVGLEVGPPSETGIRDWRALAVGDACLFWISGERWGCFPVADEGQLSAAPDLFRTKPDARTPPVLFATGTCKPGDILLIATDAVAGLLLKRARTNPDWSRYLSMDETAWRAEMDNCRTSGEMVNDDCTLVVIEVDPLEHKEHPAKEPVTMDVAIEENDIIEDNDIVEEVCEFIEDQPENTTPPRDYPC